MSKILALTHSPVLQTGNARVSRAILEGFVRAGHDVVSIGVGHPTPAPNLSFPVVAADITDTNYGQSFIPEAIAKERPDFLFTIGDPWMTAELPSMRELHLVTWLAYTTIDSHTFPSSYKDWFRSNHTIACSTFGQSVIRDCFGGWPESIPHGVDCITFRPTNKQKAKHAIGAGERFMVGTVARNQLRKNIPALIDAFSRFQAGKDDVGLFLHTEFTGKSLAWNIEDLLEYHGIKEICFRTKAANSIVQDSVLSLIYNSLDVFVLPTMGEGFGLPVLEAAACGVPSLVTNYSACTELVVDASQLVDSKTLIVGNSNSTQAIIDVDDLHNKLEEFYLAWKNKKELIGYRSDASRQMALRYDWSNVITQFVGLLDGIQDNDRSQQTHPRFHQL